MELFVFEDEIILVSLLLPCSFCQHAFHHISMSMFKVMKDMHPRGAKHVQGPWSTSSHESWCWSQKDSSNFISGETEAPWGYVNVARFTEELGSRAAIPGLHHIHPQDEQRHHAVVYRPFLQHWGHCPPSPSRSPLSCESNSPSFFTMTPPGHYLPSQNSKLRAFFSLSAILLSLGSHFTPCESNLGMHSLGSLPAISLCVKASSSICLIKPYITAPRLPSCLIF